MSATLFRCLLVAQLGLFTTSLMAQQPLYRNKAFSLYSDRVVQGKYTAKAVSATAISSDYQSATSLYQSPDLTFKFAINGKDNEMVSGRDHHFTVVPVNGAAETPLIVFGTQLNSVKPTKAPLKPDTRLKVRLDMRPVLRQFADKGYYTAFNGDKLYRQDFQGVFIAGGTAPLTWDFDNLATFKELQLKDTDGDGIYEIELVLNRAADKKATNASWQLSKDVSTFPQYTSPHTLANAVYNLALEEMINAVEPDSTFRTGKEWAGVWTRDISYSIILSMAYLQPRVAMNSLLRKVNRKKKIIQDTGTGGAWPASTDRTVWAWAAWELYLATGDKDWLNEAFSIVKNTLDDDLQTAYDPVTGLVKGESSFLDWREQTYPRWMQPADIFESECLGTNAVHYQANKVLSMMATALNQTAVADKHQLIADRIKTGINRYLWMPGQGYYAQYLYGRNYKMPSPRNEALGEALCVLLGIADEARQQQIVQRTPVTDYGIPCISPQIPNIPPYHNNGIWPFVQSYWTWAGAKAANEASVMESIAAIYRPAALFATNKENFVAANGDFAGTQINSSNMLWSLSGSISLVHKVLFGIRFREEGLAFEPFVPQALKGSRTLTNFRYRNAELDIEMEGSGNRIAAFEVDGKPQSSFLIPTTLSGRHRIRIRLLTTPLPAQPTGQQAVVFTPATPETKLNGRTLSWPLVEGAAQYIIYRNGQEWKRIQQTAIELPTQTFGEFQVVALGKNHQPSFASEPVAVFAPPVVVQPEQFFTKSGQSYSGFTGEGFVEISTTVHPTIDLPVTVAEEGMYSLSFRYANGNGPVNTENKCAIRTLYVDEVQSGVFIFPQRGRNEWSNWGWTNVLPVRLSKGQHIIRLRYEPYNENMNEMVNQAMLDQLQLVKLR